MEITRESLTGTWNNIRSDVKKAWNKLSEEEIDATKGDFKQIMALIELRYGQAKENSQKALSDIFARFADDAAPLKMKTAGKNKKRPKPTRAASSHSARSR